MYLDLGPLVVQGQRGGLSHLQGEQQESLVECTAARRGGRGPYMLFTCPSCSSGTDAAPNRETPASGVHLGPTVGATVTFSASRAHSRPSARTCTHVKGRKVSIITTITIFTQHHHYHQHHQHQHQQGNHLQPATAQANSTQSRRSGVGGSIRGGDRAWMIT